MVVVAVILHIWMAIYIKNIDEHAGFAEHWVFSLQEATRYGVMRR
jgi:hypothetical protein